MHAKMEEHQKARKGLYFYPQLLSVIESHSLVLEVRKFNSTGLAGFMSDEDLIPWF